MRQMPITPAIFPPQSCQLSWESNRRYQQLAGTDRKTVARYVALSEARGWPAGS